MNRVALLGVVAFAIGCGQKIGFDGTPGQKSLRCEEGGSRTVTKPAKFLFLVDQSGSNINGPYEHPGQATDGQKTIRYEAINNFFQQYKSRSSLSWGFMSFNDASATSLIMSGGQSTFSNGDAMSSALTTFQGRTDVGATPYRAALAAAHELIQRDIAASGNVKYLYRIAFMTDGYPTDYCNDSNATYCPQEVNETHMNADLASLMALAPGDIQLSTVYYGFPDSSASSRLERMANAGFGQFIDASLSRNINLNDVIEVPVDCDAD